MPLLRSTTKPPLKLRLARDLVRALKRGHPWVYAEALRQTPAAPPGCRAILLDNKKGREVGQGFYDPGSPLALRMCSVEPDEAVDEAWAERRLSQALALRRAMFGAETTGFRLFNGEGDGLPGLICDVYGDTAVLQLDGAGPSGFWHVAGLAEWLAAQLSLNCVYHKQQSRSSDTGQVLLGQLPAEPVPFVENGLHFTADVVQGQKTGFFLDQRENRQRMRGWLAGRRLLNVFGYTGGFSVYGGAGGATEVTTVDLARPALTLAEHHWQLNGLEPTRHRTVKADAFAFLEAAAKKEQWWDVVIIDPPSFASAKESVPQALSAYQKLVAAGAAITGMGGVLAAASCSSHIDQAAFLQGCEEGISKARRRATLLGVYGQPADHPTPLAFPEFRYLKFVLLRVD
ncbi:MAG: class I SAM-dependent rRNA methyltransferase [Anaerolineae bacterium]|nr:class I SAM-dependent rRNA methyltransferase [Anaerolineae bacterium]